MAIISLLLQNSAGLMSIGLADGDQLLFDSTIDVDLAGSRNVETYVSAAFTHSGKDIADVDCVFVDIGPGGLGATRTTVAFANALGFANVIPVIGINAFELIGYDVAQLTKKSVVCIRPAAKPNYYMAIYDHGTLSDFSFVDTDDVQSFIRRHQSTASFAGKFSFVDILGEQDDTWPVPVANIASMPSFLAVSLAKYKKSTWTKRVYPISENLVVNNQ